MMSKVALDTVILAAILDERDKWHFPALAIRDALQTTDVELIIFDVVVNETISVLARRLHEQGRESQFDLLFNQLDYHVPAHRITWISHETSRFYSEILALIRLHHGELNFHDALLALACRELAIPYIVSFDQDFDKVHWLTRIDTPANIP
jgi:predicted nucleic acid-binding protein